MGNQFGKLTSCLPRRRRHDPAAVTSDPCFSDEGLGHSFFYVRPDPSSKVHHNDDPNPKPDPLIPTTTTTTTFKSISGASVSANSSTTPLSSSALPDFDCSHSFSSVALQPFPKLLSGPLPLDRGSFLSGPIDNRGFMSGPIDRAVTGLFSGPLRRSFSARTSIFKGLRKAINVAFRQSSVIAPAKSGSSPEVEIGSESDEEPVDWAKGRAGEDRVHVVVSEDHGWVFVGIYDGFNGPDAPDYLLSELYPAVQRELKGLLWEEIGHSESEKPAVGRFSNKNWKSDWEKQRSELDRKLKEQLVQSNSEVDHSEVLEALSRALMRTEETFLDMADRSVSENPELALMGSCVLVMLMKGEDVYVMNVGDSRVILAKKPEPDVWNSGKERCDLERISEESSYNQDEMDGFPVLEARQLTMDHSTCIQEEVQRIRKEHPEDDLAVSNDRVKGSLKVTRAFGAGFLKQPKWNNALLEMFRIDYVGTSPYITCNPSLRHHRLGPKDRFLLLSSDGLYQYFTNQQAVAEVELFISMYPEGDPAQHLVEEVLLRAAKQAGMDFHELLEIPQGDRRRYHDDVSIIVISLEGRIWRSSV